jgi:hypothetical protein
MIPSTWWGTFPDDAGPANASASEVDTVDKTGRASGRSTRGSAALGDAPATGGLRKQVAIAAAVAADARNVGSLHTGQVVQIDCATRGQLVKDKDGGQQSDVWYRQAGTNRYV